VTYETRCLAVTHYVKATLYIIIQHKAKWKCAAEAAPISDIFVVQFSAFCAFCDCSLRLIERNQHVTLEAGWP